MPAVSASDFAQSLLAMLEKPSFSEMVPALETLHEKGLLNLMAPVSKYSNRLEPLLSAWLYSGFANGSYQAPRTREDFKRIERWTGDPNWLAQGAGPHKASLFDAWMSGHQSSSGMGPHHGDMLAYAPLDLILAWVPSSFPDRRADPGASFLSAVLQSQESLPGSAGKIREHDHIPMLVARGLNLTGKVNGQPVAISFDQPIHWDLFLKQGGDPQQKVRGRNDTSVPLWQHLVNSFRKEPLGEHITQLMLSSSPSAAAAVEKEALAKYWEQAKTYQSTAAIRSRKDWPTLHTPDGENVLFVLAKNERWQAFKEISSPKMAKPLLLEKDNKGRGIWHFVIQHGASSDIQGILNSAHALPHCDAQGQGFLLQGGLVQKRFQDDTACLVPQFPSFHKWESTRSVPSPLAKDADLWLAGPPDLQARVCDYMINERTLAYRPGDFSKDNAFLSVLGHDWEQDIGPQWRAAFCINELFVSNPDWAWLDKQIEHGVNFKLSPGRAQELSVWLGDKRPQALVALQKMEAQMRQIKASEQPLPAENSQGRRRLRP